MFSSKSFIVSGLTFRSLIHFDFIFLGGVTACSNFVLLPVSVQSCQHHLLKRLFPQCVFLPLLLIHHECMGYFLQSVLSHWSVCPFFASVVCFDQFCSLKSGNGTILKVALAFQILLVFHTRFLHFPLFLYLFYSPWYHYNSSRELWVRNLSVV